MSNAAGDRAEGRWDETKGKVKEAVGDATDNEDMEREGREDQLRGKGEQVKGHLRDAADKVKEGVERALGEE